jgi:hypothetical protein
MRTERERACDDQVIMAGVKPSTYARHLLSIACSLRGQEHSLRAGLAMARRSHIFDRLDAVLGDRKRRMTPGRFMTALAATLILALLSPLAALDPTVTAVEAHSGKSDISIVIDDGPETIRARWNGDIELTDDGRGIEWMSDDAYIVIAQKIDDVWYKLMVEPNSDGELEYTYMINRKIRDFDRKAAKWLGDVLVEVAPSGDLEDYRRPAAFSAPALPSLPALPELPELPELPSLGSGTITTNGTDRSISWKIDDDDLDRKTEMKGKIEFEEDDSGIARMGEDSYFKIEEKRDGKKYKLEVEPGEDGRPVYEFKIGRKTRPFEGEGEEWFAGVLRRMLPEIGINADIRVKNTYEKDGVRGIRDLIGRIDSDYAKSIHYREFFTMDGLDSRETGDVLKQAAQELESDYEMASVLSTYVDRHFTSGHGHEGFSMCMSSMESDYEKARVLKTALSRPNLGRKAMSVVLDAAGSIDSDYEAARVLSAVDPDVLSDTETRRQYFEVLTNISSDYEKARVLAELAPYAREDEELREACMEATDSIDSDYEYGRVMRALR